MTIINITIEEDGNGDFDCKLNVDTNTKLIDVVGALRGNLEGVIKSMEKSKLKEKKLKNMTIGELEKHNDLV